MIGDKAHSVNNLPMIEDKLFMIFDSQLQYVEPSADSAVQTVNRRRPSVSGRSTTVLEQASWQCHVGQFVVGFSAATETHSIPAVIPRHYPVTFLNCNTHSGPSSGYLGHSKNLLIDWLIDWLIVCFLFFVLQVVIRITWKVGLQNSFSQQRIVVSRNISDTM